MDPPPTVIPPTEAIRVLVIAQVRLYREGLAQALESRRFNVVGATATESGGITLAASTSTDIVLLDMGMPAAHIFIRSLLSQAPQAKIVGLGVSETEEDVLGCIEEGVCGYVPREGSIDELIAVIDNVMDGRMLCPPRIVAALARRLTLLRGPDDIASRVLTQREEEVADLLARGMSNKEIAVQLHIEVATVKNHIHRILDKLHARSRGQVAAQLRRSAALQPTSRLARSSVSAKK
jgi:DNA-binding NarL/FixJ family response regulator